MMLGNLLQSQKEAVMTFDQEFITKRRASKKLSSKNRHAKSHGLGCWLWLSATLSWAKASIGPSPMAWPGLAWLGSWL